MPAQCWEYEYLGKYKHGLQANLPGDVSALSAAARCFSAILSYAELMHIIIHNPCQCHLTC